MPSVSLLLQGLKGEGNDQFAMFLFKYSENLWRIDPYVEGPVFKFTLLKI
jgi:hypothetical protein